MLYKNRDSLITLPPSPTLTFNYEQMNILSIFQRLWTQLAVFMRSYIFAVIFNLPTAQVEGERLLRVPADFRNAFLLFYGPEVADQFGNLFTSFIARAANMIEGLQSNNQDLINQSTQAWYRNADEIAAFLSKINLFWDENQWRNLLYQYIQLKIDMILAILTQNYQHEIQIYDKVFDLTTIMGTYMARGIIANQLQLSAPAQQK